MGRKELRNSEHDDTNAGLAAYWHLTITERMFDRSDRGFHSSSQILPAGTHISHPLATQGYLYVLLRETQHTIRPALERQGSTRATERTAIAVSGLESGAIAMLFSPSGHIVLDPQPRPTWQVMTSHPRTCPAWGGACSPLAIRPIRRLATWPIAKSPRWPMRQ